MQPWFDPMYAWIPGTVLGVVVGSFGAVVGCLAPYGKAKGMVLGLYWLFLGASFIMLAAALIGWLQGQPYAVWYGLGLAGLIGTLVLGANYYTLRVAYRQAEQRRLEAENLG